MGVREVPTCDMFKTLQPKGLRTIEVHVAEFSKDGPDEGTTLFDSKLEVGNRGLDRVLRMVKAATRPYGARPEAKPDA